MLSARSIQKKYGNLHVLKGVNMDVKKGEVVAIVGASGAGKSTLLHVLGTLDVPDEGSLTINHQDVFGQSPKQLADFRNRHIGFVFQFHNLLPEFTALENVMLPALIAGTEKRLAVKRSEELLVLLGLQERLDHKPAALSGGEQQRAAVARALVNGPDIIFADEPSGNLDSKNAADLHRLFFTLRDQLGHTFVMVTHNLEFAAMADRQVEIRDGVI